MTLLDTLESNLSQKNKYDFLGQSYASLFPNLHKYPATMLPQIGLELLKDFKAKKSNLLDPYCGSGSSFMSGLEYGIGDFVGFDLNPLAIMISKAKLSYIDSSLLTQTKDKLLEDLDKIDLENLDNSPLQNITNLNFWIEKNAQKDLLAIFSLIKDLKDLRVKNLFLIAFSETLREVSYVRNNEFKLYRMKDWQKHKLKTKEVFTKKLHSILHIYLSFYQQRIKNLSFLLFNESFRNINVKFDNLLTSPPYGDSRTTVAYGQFSTFMNEWLGVREARKLDSRLLGGKRAKNLYDKGIMKDYILEIEKNDKKRALEISSFYFDLETSILSFMDSINSEGLVFFVVGNRRVKNIELPTDKFIAEVFLNNGFKHLKTLTRKISNKAMPLLNSPSNKTGVLSNTMNNEYLVVCKKNF